MNIPQCNFFYIVKHGRWNVVGPVKVAAFVSKDTVQLTNGVHLEMDSLYTTKGGATKECYKRNYQEEGGKRE